MTRNASLSLIPLADETRQTLPTREAAIHLNRSPHTLHIWAMNGSGPVQPLRVGGRLAWPTAELRKLLGVQPLEAA